MATNHRINKSLRERHDVIYRLARIGSFSVNNKNIIISIFERERNIKHLHFYRGEIVPDKGKGGGCLILDDNSYYEHASHLDTLSRDEIEALVQFLQSSIDEDCKMTAWKLLVWAWNENNPQYKLPSGAKMPPYDWNTIKHYS